MLEVFRKPHILRDTKPGGWPTDVIFFDVESRLIHEGPPVFFKGKKVSDYTETRHEPYLIMARRCQSKKRKGWNKVWGEPFEETGVFWKWVVSSIRPGKILYVMSLNINYDMISAQGFLLLKANGFSVMNYYQKGRTFIMDLTRAEDKAKICILDVGNFYAGSVADLGKAFDLPKMEMDFENPTLQAAIPYCRRDVEIIEKAMLTWFEFCRENDLGSFAKTTPGQAFKAYRHRFMYLETKNHPVSNKPLTVGGSLIFIHDQQKACHIERSAYYGGRVECWKIGEIKKKLIYVDVNSMYPHVMLENNYPVKLISIRNKLSKETIRELINEGKLLIGKFRIKTEIPFFPIRINNKIIFPTGEFETYLSTPEIITALDNNIIQEINDICIYSGAKIFSRYVNFFYNKRLEAKRNKDRVKDLLFKLLMNSLYGKFGQKAGGWKRLGETEDPTKQTAGVLTVFDADSNQDRTIKWIAGTLFQLGEEYEAPNGFVGVAAHVTAYARTLLFSYAKTAGLDHVYYMDTDSLFVDQEGYDKLEAAGYIHSSRLGALGVEDTSEYTIISAPKDYDFNEKKKSRKGVPRNAKVLEPNTYLTEVWPKLASYIRSGNLETYKNKVQIKTLKREYTKGLIEKDGKVKPFTLGVNEYGEVFISE